MAAKVSEKNAPGVATPERRRGYRAETNAAAMLRVAENGPVSHAVHVFDLSGFGVGFSARQTFRISDVYYFEMRDGRQAGSRIEIRSCRARPDGMFDVGAQFC